MSSEATPRTISFRIMSCSSACSSRSHEDHEDIWYPMRFVVRLRVLRAFVKTGSCDLERVRAVRADGKLELEQQFVGCRPDGVVGAPVLAANLGGLALPEPQGGLTPRVAERRIVCPIGSVETDAREPAARELVITRHVIAHAALQ